MSRRPDIRIIPAVYVIVIKTQILEDQHNQKKFNGCFNCGDLDHFDRNFPRPLNLANATRRCPGSLRSLKETQSSHSVFAEICHRLEEEQYSDEDYDLTAFNEMLVFMSSSDSVCRESDQHLDKPTEHGDTNVVDKVIEYHERSSG